VRKALGRTHGRTTGERVVERGTQAVHVRTRVGVGRARGILLRRRIVQRPHAADNGHGVGIPRIPNLDQPKIDQHHPVLRRDDDVGRLDVAVEDAATVTVGQRIQQLARPGQHLRLVQPAAAGLLHPLFQALALDIVHHQELAGTRGKVIGDARQAGVAQVGQHRRFLRELLAELAHLGRRHARRRHQLLDGAGPAQGQIEGAVDGTHAALAEQRVDAVAVLQDLANG
jgi:hypothetical protein